MFLGLVFQFALGDLRRTHANEMNARPSRSQIQNTPRQPRTTKGRPRAPQLPRLDRVCSKPSRSFLAYPSSARAREREGDSESANRERPNAPPGFQNLLPLHGVAPAARRRRVSLTSSVAYLLTALVGPLGFWNISEKFLLASPRTFSLQDRKSTRRSRTGGGAEMFREGERYKGKSTRKSRPQVRGFFFAIGQTLIDRAQDESERRGGVESVDLRWP